MYNILYLTVFTPETYHVLLWLMPQNEILFPLIIKVQGTWKTMWKTFTLSSAEVSSCWANLVWLWFAQFVQAVIWWKWLGFSSKMIALCLTDVPANFRLSCDSDAFPLFLTVTLRAWCVRVRSLTVLTLNTNLHVIILNDGDILGLWLCSFFFYYVFINCLHL